MPLHGPPGTTIPPIPAPHHSVPQLFLVQKQNAPTMENAIGPHEYHYLNHPLFSSGEAMLYYCLEHLVYTGALAFEHARVHAGHGDRVVVDRLFLSRTVKPEQVPPPGSFVLEFLGDGLFSLADMRRLVDHHVPDTHVFKTGPMQEHLMARGLLSSPLFTSAEGRQAYREVHHLLNDTEKDEDLLLADPAERDRRLAELGSNAILLHHGLMDKLREQPDLDPRLQTMLVMQKFLESGGFYHANMMG